MSSMTLALQPTVFTGARKLTMYPPTVRQEYFLFGMERLVIAEPVGSLEVDVAKLEIDRFFSIMA